METTTVEVVTQRFIALRTISKKNLLLSDQPLDSSLQAVFGLRDQKPLSLVSKLTDSLEFLPPTAELNAAFAALGIDYTEPTLVQRQQALVASRYGDDWNLGHLIELEAETTRGFYAIAASFDLVRMFRGLLDEVIGVTTSRGHQMDDWYLRSLQKAVKEADPRL